MALVKAQLLVIRHPISPKDAPKDTARYIQDQQKSIDLFVQQCSTLISSLTERIVQLGG